MTRQPRSLRRLATQLIPAGIVSVAAILVLGSLSRTPDVAPVGTSSLPEPINGEGVFTATPRPPEPEAPKAAAPRPPAPIKNAETPLPPRRPAAEPNRQIATAPPQPIGPQQPEAQADNSVMGKLRSATSTVQQAPSWAYRSVAGWFAPADPPRPPADVPRNFQTTM